MKIFVTLAVVYSISLVLILAFVYKSNQKEPEEEKMSIWMVWFVSVLLALTPTVAIAIILLTILGSANVVDMLFSLQLSMNQLIMLTIFILIYLFTIDSIIEIVVKYIVGKRIIYHVIILLSRTFVFYWIALLLEINQMNSFIIAIGVALIILIIELLYHGRKKNK
ncbi:hypothetical protein KGF86_10855 [Ornithinibacillus massiliensis]|uniref:Uncharacterized protein n=1 Tax=Ornithinibacillus massiliensis TaxID=1944633 RepID=A0ABS5MEF4_9BACI|nr:hypothetical protein [Ornithinibacillus massiliensis]MBS3680716.1 hypothetical protein [Ornithinibacillus massiliensis]